MKGPGAAPAVRTAVLAASDPCGMVRRWKLLSGRKAVGCPPRFPVPEILHAVGMLPVFAPPGGEFGLLEPLIDEWAGLPDPFPQGIEEALYWVESAAEWAEGVSGVPCSEGALERSLRAYLVRDSLARRFASHPGLLDPAALDVVMDSGRFLPVETHAMLLAGILGEDPAAGTPGEAEGGDPFLQLARRIVAVREGRKASGESERRFDP